MLRAVTPRDAAAIAGIYNYYVKNTVITFEEQPVSIGEMEERIRTITLQYPYFVLEENNEIQGYAYINKYRERSAYRYTAELTIYLKNGLEGKGKGSLLMAGVLEEARKRGIHSVLSVVTLPNERSAAIHEKFGFAQVACLKEAGFKCEKWLDVGFWELILK
jgi:phosphinothricin acetyltransferase